MARVLTLLVWEVRLQARYYIYAGAGATIAVMAGLIALLPVELPAEAVAGVIFIDAGVLGFFFVGVLVLMEKSERTLSALSVTPTPAWAYLAARCVSLTLLTVLGGFVISILDFGGRVDLAVLALALGLTASASVLAGFVVVSGVESLNAYLFRATAIMVVLALPLLGFVGLLDRWAVAILPSHASFLLLIAAVEPELVSRAEWWYSIAYLGFWLVLTWVWANRIFERRIVAEFR